MKTHLLMIGTILIYDLILLTTIVINYKYNIAYINIIFMLLNVFSFVIFYIQNYQKIV